MIPRERLKRLVRKIEKLLGGGVATFILDSRYNLVEYVALPGSRERHPRRLMDRRELIDYLEGGDHPVDILAIKLQGEGGGAGLFIDRWDPLSNTYRAEGWAAGGLTLLEAAKRAAAAGGDELL